MEARREEGSTRSVHATDLAPTPAFSTELLAPASLVRKIVDDWFEFIYPLTPILHRDTFLSQYTASETVNNPDLTALVLSLCAITVTILHHRPNDYRDVVTAGRCYTVLSASYLNQEPDQITLVRCQVKYNMALSLGSEVGLDSAIGQRLFTQAMAEAAYLLHYEDSQMSFLQLELTKRLYWLCFDGQW